MQPSDIVECRARCRRCSLISVGPVAQLSPSTSIPSGSSAVSAAPISVPSSMVPVVSTVTWTIRGRSLPAASSARRLPMIAALACSRSWAVSMTTASMPPASMPRTCSSYASRSSAKVTCPSVGSFVPGPTDPSTQRGRSSVLHSSAASRAIRAAASASSPIRSEIPYSPRLARLAPNVLVSTASAPAS